MTTRGQFVQFSKADFEAAFPSLNLLGSEGQELVYGRHFHGGSLLVKVYSSIDAGTEISRSVGEDAIRMSIIAVKHDFPLIPKQRRINRTAPAKLSADDAKAALFERLREKLNTLREETISTFVPCQCGGVLYLRPSKFKGGKPFRACSGFRSEKCKGRQSGAAAQPEPQGQGTSTPAKLVRADALAAALKGGDFEPSTYQQDIYRWGVEGEGNAVVEAVAGSGKTTTIVDLLKLLAGQIIFLAFNVSIKNELAKRVPSGVMVKTLNGFGHGACLRAMGKLDVSQNDERARNAIRAELIEARGLDERNEEVKELMRVVLSAVSLAKATLVDVHDVEALVRMLDRYNIDANGSFDTVVQVVPAIMERLRDVRGVKKIDFSDQAWLPIVNNFPVTKHDWVLVDEAQDLNLCQIELIKRSLKPGGRIICVGDRNQSIYGFRGADSRAIPRLIEELDATTLPLSISYRCPQAVIAKAQKIVPQIQAADSAIEGEVQYRTVDADRDATLDELVDGDMVLCRTNSPLINMVYSLIRRGKKASIQGRDIGTGLSKLVTKIGGTSLSDFLDRLTQYAEIEGTRLIALKEKGTGRLQSLIDRMETLLVLSENVTTIKELQAAIESIFTNDKAGVICSTVHRAKGLEAKKVVIIRPDLMPHPMAKTEHEREQEANLEYVAITRAQETLIFLEGDEGKSVMDDVVTGYGRFLAMMKERAEAA